ncbi:unnamed protein product [Symbiodinium necroappetens]|uniref:Uncharacterized protein n=1 Tax=Symbiodinium necroappetens TaxID=1628268 RepID=A0A812WJJ7_9DINO|nr:unnamed protein product [Symbiodinium necroappetens]
MPQRWDAPALSSVVLPRDWRKHCRRRAGTRRPLRHYAKLSRFMLDATLCIQRRSSSAWRWPWTYKSSPPGWTCPACGRQLKMRCKTFKAAARTEMAMQGL